jgi:DNA-directed RNA polymerase specialized sigma24 family protein
MLKGSKEIFSESIKAGRRVYFIDVKESHEGVKYLVISESRSSQEAWEHSRVMIFQEHIPSFARALKKALETLDITFPEVTTYSQAKIRRRYPKAYMRWTREEEAILSEGFFQGKSVEELANILERKPGAIRSRLRKLGLQDSGASSG